MGPEVLVDALSVTLTIDAEKPSRALIPQYGNLKNGIRWADESKKAISCHSSALIGQAYSRVRRSYVNSAFPL